MKRAKIYSGVILSMALLLTACGKDKDVNSSIPDVTSAVTTVTTEPEVTNIVVTTTEEVIPVFEELTYASLLSAYPWGTTLEAFEATAPFAFEMVDGRAVCKGVAVDAIESPVLNFYFTEDKLRTVAFFYTYGADSDSDEADLVSAEIKEKVSTLYGDAVEVEEAEGVVSLNWKNETTSVVMYDLGGEEERGITLSFSVNNK